MKKTFKVSSTLRPKIPTKLCELCFHASWDEYIVDQYDQAPNARVTTYQQTFYCQIYAINIDKIFDIPHPTTMCPHYSFSQIR